VTGHDHTDGAVIEGQVRRVGQEEWERVAVPAFSTRGFSMASATPVPMREIPPVQGQGDAPGTDADLEAFPLPSSSAARRSVSASPTSSGKPRVAS
jgi:hypothetical protein